MSPLFKPGKIKLIAYLLKDLHPESPELKSYREACPFVEFRKFNFSKYPSEISINLFEYRWKPLLYAEALQKHELVLFMDASIAFVEDGFQVRNL